MAALQQSSSTVQSEMVEVVDQLLRSGQAQDAGRLCKKPVSPDAENAEDLHLLGIAALESGTYDVAVARLQEAVSADPSIGLFHFNLGVALAKLSRTPEAIAAFEQSARIGFEHSQLYSNLSLLLWGEGQKARAIATMQRAVELEPTNATTYNKLGAMLWEEQRIDQAISHFRSALHLDPNLTDASVNLGYALLQGGQLREAATVLRRALDLGPPPDHLAGLHVALGSIYFEQNSNDEACASFRRAVKAEPISVNAHTGLGNALLRAMRLEEAAASYRAALDMDPDYPQAHFGLAMTLLTLGEWKTGGREYEWRLRQGRQVVEYGHYARLRRWNGEAATGQTLLIVAEGGFGDTLQFCRYATLAAEQGMRVIMAVQPELVRLLSGLPGVHQVLPVGSMLPPFDVFCPMISLPFIFGSTPANVPHAGGYLNPDPAKCAAWQQRLSSISRQGARIGLVWAGNPRPGIPDQEQMNARRSLRAERLEPFFDVPGLQFFSLQKFGTGMPPAFPVVDFMEEMSDFADTAALVANLDLVISVDSGMAHLVGALGKPVWLLSRFDSCWRWLDGRSDSPWYDKMRIYRQPYPGAWDPVLTKVAGDLHRLKA